jgi:serine/threonine protein kinase
MPAAGDLIEGKYRLVRQIGEGGMATVWEAEHERLQTRVAVKFLAGLHFGKEADRARFLDEARAAAAIRHRNVIDIVDFGTTDDDTPFMVMELLSGQTLADRIEADAPMAVPAVVELAVQMLGALIAVHDAGIVHRDLKPENVMFALDADGAVPKLVDFGISKILDRDEDPKRPKTREGLLLGTPQYMSPEQASGSTSIDKRSDIYAFGVILYEMLTGERPYDNESVVKLLSAVLEGTARRVDVVRPDLPAVIADVVTKAMSNDVNDRYADARELRTALIEAMKAPQDPRPPDAVTVPPPGRGRREEPESRPEPTKPRRVELPDPRPMPPPSSGSRGVIFAVLAVVGIAAIGAVAWLAWPRDEGAPEEEAAIGSEPSDAGIANPSGFITVRLLEVPDDAFVVLDGEIIDPERVRDLRQEDGVIPLPVAVRRGPFDLRVRVRGHREWRVRRWTRRDFEFTVRPRPE